MENNMEKENLAAVKGARSAVRKLAMVAFGTGLGAALAYLLSKGLRALGESPQPAARRHLPDHIVDDHGTGQEKAAKILRNLRDRAFDASDEKLALALGRPLAEITAWHAGQEVIDDDVVMKARGIAMHRGVHVE